MATFITAQSVGNDINIYVETSTTYWKYNHDGTDSSVFSNGNQTVTVANANGEFTIIPCLSDGTVSGDITYLNFNEESGVVLVEMKGSCAGCPSSSVTLKNGIEGMLKHYV